MMTITDQFGREYERIEDFAPAAIADEVALYAEETDRGLWEAIFILLLRRNDLARLDGGLKAEWER